MPNDGLLCWNCSKPTGIQGNVTRSDACPQCLADLRCCHGCRHFDPSRRFQCRETVEHNVLNKEKNNFCDFFQIRNVIKRPGGISTQTESKDTRKKKFDNLFDD